MSASTAPVTVYVPRDSAARSVGADEVADALARAAARHGRPIRLVRNGSRGMLWLEPLVEVATPDGRIGYGPVAASDVDGLVAAGLFDGAELPQRLGVVGGDRLLFRANAGEFSAPVAELYDTWWNSIARAMR